MCHSISRGVAGLQSVRRHAQTPGGEPCALPEGKTMSVAVELVSCGQRFGMRPPALRERVSESC